MDITALFNSNWNHLTQKVKRRRIDEQKPHQGRIVFLMVQTPSNSVLAFGEFLDHPYHRGMGSTSAIVAADPKTHEIETRRSRYTLVVQGEPSRLRDLPMKGDVLLFTPDNGGYEYERKEAVVVLDTSTEYRVKRVEIGSSRTAVELEGVAGSWNSVMFRNLTVEKENADNAG